MQFPCVLYSPVHVQLLDKQIPFQERISDEVKQDSEPRTGGRPLLPSNGKASTAIKWEGLLLPSNGKASTAIKWEGLLLPSNGKASAAIKWETGKVLKLLNFSFCVGVRKIKGKLQGAIWVENISSKGNGLR